MPAAGPMFLQPFALNPRMDDLPSSYVDGIRISVLRLDLPDPILAGNKWYKLRYYLDHAIVNNMHVVTFGGAWSNHIIATAAACQQSGISCTGIIRGEEPAVLSATLSNARRAGMELVFVSRQDYRDKKIPDRFNHPSCLVIPEGGSGPEGVEGASTILSTVDTTRFSHCFCAVGTGTTLAGLLSSPLRIPFITGIPVLKNPGAANDIRSLLNMPVPGNTRGAGQTTATLKEPSGDWELITGYEFGGYAKYTPVLTDFMNDFYRITSIPSDFVYTGKLFYAMTDLLRNGYVKKGTEVLVIHSGGLQGNAGLPANTLSF